MSTPQSLGWIPASSKLGTAKNYWGYREIPVIENGTLTFKMWGAGGEDSTYGGAGGFVSGNFPVISGDVIKIYTGRSGYDPSQYSSSGLSFYTISSGLSYIHTVYHNSHINSQSGGDLNTKVSGGGGSVILLNSVLIAVAGGGGGKGVYNEYAGAGGGLVGQTGNTTGGVPTALGGTQTSGYSFLHGQGGGQSTGGYRSGGGGGGYYGGRASVYSSGGGGSSWTHPTIITNVQNIGGNYNVPGNSSDPDRGTAGNPGVGGLVLVWSL